MKLLLVCVLSALALAQAVDVDWSKIKPRHINPWFMESIFNNSPLQNRIVGGQEAVAGQYPFQAALFVEIGGATYFCGGTLISENYVLTAAHCVDGASSSRVVLGAHNIRQEEPSQVSISVERAIVHEAYDEARIINDIAVLKLSDPAPLNDRISLVTLPTYSDASNTFAGSLAETAGWGQISDNISGISSVLRYVENNIITNLLCNISFLGLIQNSHICMSGSDGKSTCSGDSGGPLLVQGKQVGITSFGISLGCEIGWPAAFTRVTSFLDWIAANTDVEILS